MIGCGTIRERSRRPLSHSDLPTGTGDYVRLTRSESPLVGLSDG